MPLLAIADSIRRKQPGTEFLLSGYVMVSKRMLFPTRDIPSVLQHQAECPAPPVTRDDSLFVQTADRDDPGVLYSSPFQTSPDHRIWRVCFCSSGFHHGALPFSHTGHLEASLYIHEQNAAPGRMNLAAARIATMVGVSHASALKHFPASKTSLVGYPVRGDFSHPERQHARQDLGISDQDFYIVAFGGSQGARTLNRAVIDSLPLLSDLPGIRIYHLTGRIRSTGYDAVMDSKERLERLQHVKIRYQQEAYSHDTATHLAACDLAIIRAGSGSLLEICSMGLPAIVIPKANLPGDSQVLNARELYDREAIELLYEEPVLSGEGLVEAVDGKVLAEKIHQLYHSPEKKEETFPKRKSECRFTLR